MKKSLLALAVLGAFAGSAAAASVTVYGLVDYGFAYTHADGDVAGQDAQDSFQMKSGMNSGSRFGLKGSEDLGNGYKVSFVLENGFNDDDGTLDNGGRLFGREASMTLSGSFGQISFGRMGQFASSLGTYGLLGNVSPFSTGWGSITGLKFVQANGHTRYDNTVTYKTPTFAGVNVMAQYSFKNDTSKDGLEGESEVDRAYGVAVTYNAENLYLVGIVDSINYASALGFADARDLDDSLTVTLGGNYDFGVAKLYFAGQYFDNAKGVGQSTNIKMDGSFVSGSATEGYIFKKGAEGYSLALGVGVPAFGGTAKAHVGYLDAEDTEDSNRTLTRWNIAVGYDYAISKRTSVYTAATYMADSWEPTASGKDDRDPSAVEVMAGLIHKF